MGFCSDQFDCWVIDTRILLQSVVGSDRVGKLVYLRIYVHAAQKGKRCISVGWCGSGCFAVPDWMGRGPGFAHSGRMDTVCDSVLLAVPTFLGNCMDCAQRLFE